MPNLPSLVVDVLGRNAGLKKTFREGQDLARGFARNVVNVLAPIAGAMGLKESIDAWRVQDRAVKTLDATLAATGNAAGLTSKEIQGLASDLQSVTNYGDEATIAAAAMLATFKEIKGDQFKQATALAQDMSAVLQVDLKSSIIQVGKALNDPTKGITALSRAGVSFTEQQKEQIKVLQESGDLLGAQKVILKELEGEFGGAAKAQADPLIQAKNAAGDYAETIGAILKPAIDDGAKAAIRFLQAIMPTAETVDVLGKGVKFLGTTLGPVIAGWGIVTAGVWAYNRAAKVAIAMNAFLSATSPGGLVKLGLAAGAALGTIGALDLAINGFGSEASAAAPPTKVLTDGQNDLADAAERAGQALSGQGKAVVDYVDKLNPLLNRLREIRGLQNEGAIDKRLAEFLRTGEIKNANVGALGNEKQDALFIAEQSLKKLRGLKNDIPADIFANMETSLKQAIGELSGLDKALTETEKQIFALKNSEIDVKVADFALQKNVLPAEVEQYRKNLEEIDRLAARKKEIADNEAKTARAEEQRIADIKALRESLRSPAQELAAEAERLKGLIGAGGLSGDEVAQALKKKAEQLLGPQAPNDIPEFQAGAVTSATGSDAYRAILAAQRDARNPQQKIEKISADQLKEQKEINAALAAQLKLLEKTPPLLVADGT